MAFLIIQDKKIEQHQEKVYSHSLVVIKICVDILLDSELDPIIYYSKEIKDRMAESSAFIEVILEI